jgi:DNA repair exonuclease SbcCD ATPase subunit
LLREASSKEEITQKFYKINEDLENRARQY